MPANRIAASRHKNGADETNRTSDLLITNQLLYRLSYISKDIYFIKEPRVATRHNVLTYRTSSDVDYACGLFNQAQSQN